MAQPQVVMAQPQVVMAQPGQQATTVVMQGGVPQKYCGPVSWLIGCLLFWFFIGPFAILVCACPCDDMPQQQTQVIRTGAPEKGDECLE